MSKYIIKGGKIMAYGFNDDKSKAIIKKKAIKMLSDVSVSAQSGAVLHFKGDTSGIVSIVGIIINDGTGFVFLSDLYISGWNVLSDGVDVCIKNTSNNTITIKKNSSAVVINYWEAS